MSRWELDREDVRPLVFIFNSECLVRHSLLLIELLAAIRRV